MTVLDKRNQNYPFLVISRRLVNYCVQKGKRKTHPHRDIQREREIQTKRERHTEREKYSDRDRNAERKREREKYRERERERERENGRGILKRRRAFVRVCDCATLTETKRDREGLRD
jgi:hypothetical protein